MRYGGRMKQLLLPFLLLSLACSGAPLTPKVADAIAIADCQLDAVKALVPHVETAEAVVAAARIGDIDRVVALLVALGLESEQIKAVAMAFAACVPQPSEPQPAAVMPG